VGVKWEGLNIFAFNRKKYIIIDENKKCKNFFYIFSITLSLLKGEFTLLFCSTSSINNCLIFDDNLKLCSHIVIYIAFKKRFVNIHILDINYKSYALTIAILNPVHSISIQLCLSHRLDCYAYQRNIYA
jgi:hypothetical protein